jgi:hypothetical protein
MARLIPPKVRAEHAAHVRGGVPEPRLLAGHSRTLSACFDQLREFGPPIADRLALMPYTDVQTMLDAAFPPGAQCVL